MLVNASWKEILSKSTSEFVQTVKLGADKMLMFPADVTSQELLTPIGGASSSSGSVLPNGPFAFGLVGPSVSLEELEEFIVRPHMLTPSVVVHATNENAFATYVVDDEGVGKASPETPLPFVSPRKASKLVVGEGMFASYFFFW